MNDNTTSESVSEVRRVTLTHLHDDRGELLHEFWEPDNEWDWIDQNVMLIEGPAWKRHPNLILNLHPVPERMDSAMRLRQRFLFGEDPLPGSWPLGVWPHVYNVGSVFLPLDAYTLSDEQPGKDPFPGISLPPQ